MSRSTAQDNVDSISAQFSRANIHGTDSTEADHSFAASAISTARTSETLNSDAEESGDEDEDDEASALDSLNGGDSLDPSDSSDSLEEEGNDSRVTGDDYSGVEDSLDEDSGSEFDELQDSEGEGLDDDSEENDDDDEEDAKSVDLELEEAKEMIGMAISVHTKALRTAAQEGMHVTREKTILSVVKVVRAIVNLIGPLQEGPVTPEVILEQLRSCSQLLLNEDREFIFEDGLALMNKYLSIVKYAYDDGDDDDTRLEEALRDLSIKNEEDKISLKTLVRRLKHGETS